MIKNNNNMKPRFRVLAAVSFFGLFFSILFVVILKKCGIYENEYEFGRKITIIIFIAFVVVPLAYYALFLSVDKILDPLLHKIFSRLHQRRIEKYGYKIVSREDRYRSRINKIMGQYVICYVFLIYLCWFALILSVLGIRRLQVPEGDLSKDNTTMILCIIAFLVGSFLSLIIGIRVFKKKNGIKKTLKYAVELKKQPRLFTRFWLKLCGIDGNDIQNYLSEVPRK